jgi:hypothetical protein
MYAVLADGRQAGRLERVLPDVLVGIGPAGLGAVGVAPGDVLQPLDLLVGHVLSGRPCQVEVLLEGAKAVRFGRGPCRKEASWRPPEGYTRHPPYLAVVSAADAEKGVGQPQGCEPEQAA